MDRRATVSKANQISFCACRWQGTTWWGTPRLATSVAISSTTAVSLHPLRCNDCFTNLPSDAQATAPPHPVSRPRQLPCFHQSLRLQAANQVPAVRLQITWYPGQLRLTQRLYPWTRPLQCGKLPLPSRPASSCSSCSCVSLYRGGKHALRRGPPTSMPMKMLASTGTTIDLRRSSSRIRRRLPRRIAGRPWRNPC
ncbi:hypothetical protein H310_10132 [Aphanomyces invadans]|uniref:Uncharacterized protein n=1 Tax=Aphanomyces invadans TaxID=157072 RepID=A0A024TRS9_9STRA|nr:hypothetical protein H310_10132 [Aphanomyces invadans]ETV96845.1 hypothetical protein H310_10132 [Aphanomyces invadans]|eukprot:XP_008874622.1 hypothetical protein H310_10132 [Aphanomyces invadans]